MLRAEYLFEVSSGITVPGSMSQKHDAVRSRERGGDLGIIARLLGLSLAAQLPLLPMGKVMKEVVRIVGAQNSRSLGRTFDREETSLMVVHCHYHVERCGFDRGCFLHHIHRSGRHFRTLEKLPKLRDVLGCQLFSMRLMNDMSVPTDRKQKSAIRLLTGRTEPIDEMQNVRPGKIAGAWMPEYRLEHTSIPIKNPMRCRHVWLPLASGRRCVACGDEIAGFGGLVAGETGLVQGPVAGFSVLEVSEPPAARRGVFF
jgi:hypothetical protein